MPDSMVVPFSAGPQIGSTTTMLDPKEEPVHQFVLRFYR